MVAGDLINVRGLIDFKALTLFRSNQMESGEF